MHVYEVRPRKDHRGVDLISDALPFGGLWYGEPDAISNAIGYAKFRSPSHDAVIRVFDEAVNVIETHEHAWRIPRTVMYNLTPSQKSTASLDCRAGKSEANARRIYIYVGNRGRLFALRRCSGLLSRA